MQKQASGRHHPHLEVRINHNSSTVNKEIDNRWIEIKIHNNFSPRSYFASCIQAGNIYIHGGFSSQLGNLKDFYVCCLYDTPISWKPLQAKSSKQLNPGSLRNHTLNSYSSNLILVGGQKNVIQNNKQIFKFNLLTNIWTKCKCIDSHGKTLNIALDSHNTFIHKNYMYVYGGYDSTSTDYFTGLVKINLQKIGQNHLTYQMIKFQGQKPSERANSSCALVNNHLYLFGGGKVDQVFDDFWMLDIQTMTWTQMNRKQSINWPDKRKGATLVHHEQSNSLFLFGGFKNITKQQNDVMVYLINSKRWLKIHSNTNQLYDPSPTIKEIAQSPTIIQQKLKKSRTINRSEQKSKGSQTGFTLGMKAVITNEPFSKLNETSGNFKLTRLSASKPFNMNLTTTQNFTKKISVVQQKKNRQFMNRKKKLLGNIQQSYKNDKKVRTSHSPTSEALIYSISCMGQQCADQYNQAELPKVIYDEQKGHVIGKKPCARDGHCALLHDQTMIIIGGDRHKISFSDAYFFNLNKGVESLPYYE